MVRLFSSYSWLSFGLCPWLVEFAERLGFHVTTVIGFLAPVWLATLVSLRPSLDVYTKPSEQSDNSISWCMQLLTTLEDESWGKSESPRLASIPSIIATLQEVGYVAEDFQLPAGLGTRTQSCRRNLPLPGLHAISIGNTWPQTCQRILVICFIFSPDRG